MSSSPVTNELLKTQMDILTRLGKSKIYKNDPCVYDHGVKISRSSSTYTLTTKLEPFSENDVEISPSQDKKFVIVDFKTETLFESYHIFHQLRRTVNIPDEYDVDTLKHQILDGILTITVETKRGIIKESEKRFASVLADQERVTLHEATPYVNSNVPHKKSAKDADADLLPIRVMQSPTIDPFETVPESPQFYKLPEINASHIQYDEKGFGDRPDIAKLIDDMWKKAIKDNKPRKKSASSLTIIDASAPVAGTSKEFPRTAQIIPESEAKALIRKKDVEENVDEEKHQMNPKTIPEAICQDKEAEQIIDEKKQQMDVKIPEVVCEKEDAGPNIDEEMQQMSETETVEETVEDISENVRGDTSSQDGVEDISKDVCVREEGGKARKEHDTQEPTTYKIMKKVGDEDFTDREVYKKKTPDVKFQEGTPDSKTQGKTPESKTLKQTPDSKAPKGTPDSKKKKQPELKKKVEIISKEVEDVINKIDEEDGMSKAEDRETREEKKGESEPAIGKEYVRESSVLEVEEKMKKTCDETEEYEMGEATIENKSDIMASEGIYQPKKKSMEEFLGKIRQLAKEVEEEEVERNGDEKTKREEDTVGKREEKKDDENDLKKSENKTPPRPIPPVPYGSGKKRFRGRGRR